MPTIERVPFQEAIEDPRLLKNHFATLSRQQAVVLKAFYGLPLVGEELDDWSMFQGGATYDALGFPISINQIPYTPKEYSKLIAILGRRSGKTDRISATIIAYEATLGGHQAHVAAKQDYQIYFVGQDLGMATSHIKFVAAALESSPLLAKYITNHIGSGITLKNGLTIVPQPPTIKSARGMAIPLAVLDEVGFWYTDAKSANPDFEVEIAIKYAQMQFPFAKEIVTSTPWTKEGLLWKYDQVGTDGVKLRCDDCKRIGIWRCVHRAKDQQKHDGVLVVHSPTAAMGNPRNTRKRIIAIQRDDPDAFQRESMAEFVDSISGFLPSSLVGDAIDQKVTTREYFPRRDHPEDPRPIYIAAMDPAFRQDSFAFTILHHDPKVGMVQDRFIQWQPAPKVPLNPTVVLDQIVLILREFNISHVYSDQYQLESLQELAAARGFTIIKCDFTGQSKANIYGSLEMLVKQRRIRLLDDPSLYQQLVQLEKRITPNKTVLIGAPAGKHDDGPAVLALAVYQATWLLTPETKSVPKPPTHVEEGLADIRRKHYEQMMLDEDDW